eukprot:COSAG02_NODE_27517_length_607_cov_26.050992_1_plen_56_part_10
MVGSVSTRRADTGVTTVLGKVNSCDANSLLGVWFILLNFNVPVFMIVSLSRNPCVG